MSASPHQAVRIEARVQLRRAVALTESEATATPDTRSLQWRTSLGYRGFAAAWFWHKRA